MGVAVRASWGGLWGPPPPAAACEGAAGVSILPRTLVQRYLDDGRLVHLLPGLVAPGLNMYLQHRAGRFVPPKVRAFIDFVKRRLALVPDKAMRNATPRR